MKRIRLVLLFCVLPVFPLAAQGDFHFIAKTYGYETNPGLQDRAVLDSLQRWEEQLTLHVDREAAYPGDYLFFKAYATTGPQRVLFSPSGVLKVELVNRKQEVVSTQYYPLRGGTADGAVPIPDKLDPGAYTLRAYTRWMQNYGSQQYFTRHILITEDPQSVATETGMEQVAEVRFFPEGGKLLLGLNNKVIIRAWDALGSPVDPRGDIRDQAGRQVVDVKPYDSGLGMAILTPEAGASYTMHLENGQQYALPPVREAGYSMQVNPLDPEHIKISVTAVGITADAPLQLRGKIGEQVIMEKALELDASGSMQLEVPKAQMRGAIIDFALLGPDGQVLAQRPVRMEGPEALQFELSPLTQDFSKGGVNTFRLRVTDAAGNPVQTEVSLSVMADNGLALAGLADHLRPDPGTADINAFRRALFLGDLKAMASANEMGEPMFPDEILYPIQGDLELIGYAYDLNNELLRNTDIQVMSSTDDNLFITEVRTDPSGILKVSGMDFSGEIPLIFRTLGEDTPSSLVRFEPLHDEIYRKNVPFKKNESTPIQRAEPEVKRKGRPLVETTPWAVIDTTGLIQLAQATVTAKKQEVQETPSNYGIEPRRVIRQDPEKPAISIGELLQRMPGVFVSGDIFTAPNIYVPSAPPGPTRWVVDGLMLIANDNPFDLIPIIDIERIELLSAADASIYGSRGTGAIFAIYTRNGSALDFVRRKDAMVTFKGYAPALSFEEYLEQQSKNRKLRKQVPATLYWNPRIETDEKGEAIVRFRSPGDYGKVRVTAETVTPDGRVGKAEKVF